MIISIISQFYSPTKHHMIVLKNPRWSVPWDPFREIEHEMTFEPEVEIDGAPSARETHCFHHKGPEVCWLNPHSMNALVDSDSDF